MRRSATTLALLIAASGVTGTLTAQEFNYVDYYDQAAEIDRLVRPEEPEASLKPYRSPLQWVYFEVEAAAFFRGSSSSSVIATVNNPPSAALRSDDVEFAYEPGVRALAGMRLNPNFAFEATYLGLFVWDADKTLFNQTTNSLGTSGNIFSPFTLFGNPPQVGLDFNNLVSERTITKFYGGDLNLRQRLDMPYSNVQVSALYGARYLNVRDRFQYRSRSFSPAPIGAINFADVDARNDMFGPQLGGTIEFHIERRAWLNIESKACLLFCDEIAQSTRTISPLIGPGLTSLSERSQDRVTFAFDVQAALSWTFTPRLVGRAGYQAIFIDGLALGAENFARNAPNLNAGIVDLDHSGQLLLHGAFIGLTATW